MWWKEEEKNYEIWIILIFGHTQSFEYSRKKINGEKIKLYIFRQ
jgi:hypothetical protein